MMKICILIFAVIAAACDLKTRRIPNALMIYMFGIWVLLVAVFLFANTENTVIMLTDSVFGLLFGGGLFIAVYFISRQGLGGGDVKFMAIAGLYLGLGSTISSILYGTVLAAATGIVLILLKKITRKDKMPLAPFLLAGIVITILLT